MPVDPKSIAPGKSYVTATRHVRTVLEVTTDRIRYAYGGGESGGVSQWRWQTIEKFAEDAVKEIGSDDGPSGSSHGSGETEKSPDAAAAPEKKKSSSRPTLTTSKGNR